MSTAIKVVAPVAPEVTALTKACEALAEQSSLARFEIAVKSRLEHGINDDNDLRITDELLHAVVLGADGVDILAKPEISAAHARHKALLAVANEWKARWNILADGLKSAILKYKKAKEELARRQQLELDRLAEEERKRKEAEARSALREGNVEGFKEIMQEAQSIVAPVIAEATPILDHSQGRKPWQVEIFDPMALLRAVVAGAAPMSVIKEWNVTLLKQEATRRGGLPPEWGCRAWQEDALSVRRR